MHACLCKLITRRAQLSGIVRWTKARGFAAWKICVSDCVPLWRILRREGYSSVGSIFRIDRDGRKTTSNQANLLPSISYQNVRGFFHSKLYRTAILFSHGRKRKLPVELIIINAKIELMLDLSFIIINLLIYTKYYRFLLCSSACM